MVRLSVCIPTHDGRGSALEEALDSIVCQLTSDLRDQVEICISDNASQDETQALVARYREANPGLIRYSRNSENLGFSRNLVKVMALAKGDYCWLFSSDDTMVENSLIRVLTILETHPVLAGITINFQSLDKHLQPLASGGYPQLLLPDDWETPQLFTSPAQIFRQCGSVQGYTSAQVFSHRLWAEALAEIGEDKFMSFTYFPYLFLFGKMVKKCPFWMWLPEKLINNRTQNDYLAAHLQRNALKYHTLTMEEASKVWGELFGRRSATYQRLMRNNYLSLWSGRLLVYSKGLYPCTASDEVKALAWFTRRLFFLPEFWVSAFPVLLLPRIFFQMAAALVTRLGYKPRSLRAARPIEQL